MDGSGVQKKTEFEYLLDLFGERRGQGVMWFSVFGTSLDDWDDGGFVEAFVHMVSMVLVLLRVGVILGNGYEI